MKNSEGLMSVELIYIAANKSLVQLKLDLREGATVAEALEKSGILINYPETRLLPVGIFAKKISLDTLLKPGDRIEIYRSLHCDPKEKRRQRAKTTK